MRRIIGMKSLDFQHDGLVFGRPLPAPRIGSAGSALSVYRRCQKDRPLRQAIDPCAGIVVRMVWSVFKTLSQVQILLPRPILSPGWALQKTRLCNAAGNKAGSGGQWPSGEAAIMIERSSDAVEARCKECGAIAEVASAQMTGRPDDRCKQGYAKNIQWCPSMRAAVSEAIAKRVGRESEDAVARTRTRQGADRV